MVPPTTVFITVRFFLYDVTAGDDSIRVLHVDDDEAFSELVADSLERRTEGVVVVETPSDAATALTHLDEGLSVDCLLSDYAMPGANGLEFLAGVRERRPRLPFVLYTSHTDEELVAEALAQGVSAHVRKGAGRAHYVKLANRIRRAVSEARAEATVDRLEHAMNAVREGVCVVGADGCVKYANRVYLDLFDYDREELLGERWERVAPADADTVVGDVLPFTPDNEEWCDDGVDSDERSASVSETPDGELVVTVREFETGKRA